MVGVVDIAAEEEVDDRVRAAGVGGGEHERAAGLEDAVDLGQGVDGVLGQMLDDLAPGDHIEGVIGVGKVILLGVEAGAGEVVLLIVFRAGEGLADFGAAIGGIAGEGEIVVAKLPQHEGDVEGRAAQLEEASALFRLRDDPKDLAPEWEAAIDEDLVDGLVAVIPAEAEEVAGDGILVALVDG